MSSNDSSSDLDTVRAAFLPQVVEEKLALFDEVARLVRIEYTQALLAHPSYHSAHEGMSIMKEEVDELWEHVRADTGDSQDALGEAVQVASTAMRFATDICGRHVK